MTNLRRILGLLSLWLLLGGVSHARAQDPEEIPAQPPPLPADWSYIEPVCKKFFGALRTASLTALNDSIKADWAQDDSSIPMSSGLNSFLQSAGPLTRYRLMRIESIKDLGVSDLPPDMYRVKFLCFHEARPVIWQLEFLKWREKWKLFRVDFETEYIFESLSKSVLEVRALKAQSPGILRGRP
jgi:hypothetical protein